MKILLFGISNVGKTTIGKILSKKMKYKFDDLDDEIKRWYGTIDKFQAEYPYYYERHKKRGEILKDIVNKYDDNVVIAVSILSYSKLFNRLIEDENILAIQLEDDPENILKRLVYADENDVVHKLEIKDDIERKYYLKDIKKDITFYKRVYIKIENKFNINGRNAEEAADKLLSYINAILFERYGKII